MALAGSIQSRHLPITQLPLAQILRPIPPVIDAPKVDSMVQTLRGEACDFVPSPAPERIEPGKLPPVDVLHYHSKAQDRDYYFAFGGCHRMQAYEKAGVDVVDVRRFTVLKPMLKMYLGASVDRIVGEEE
ncbi:sulfiredoxin-1 [Neofusicoccum parvum]|uniref:Sulfiredoxin n=3 Tax=Neofusicoccum TaxID=407951 RepID=R1EXQ9_BOTPV|nr:putative -like nuclease protein [Neofusicoccum parvum UCRNP2]GME42285.1 sulfiredoxin-1 [Neofusicoccum parvum]GME48428.1 sulfiredoxin-1 [Neofusicoccum parvum]